MTDREAWVHFAAGALVTVKDAPTFHAAKRAVEIADLLMAELRQRQFGTAEYVQEGPVTYFTADGATSNGST